MKVRVEIKDQKIRSYYGLFTSKERKLIRKEFNKLKSKKAGIIVLNVKDL